jgi:hypothetical protein
MRLLVRSFVDIQIAAHQNVYIKIADIKMETVIIDLP